MASTSASTSTSSTTPTATPPGGVTAADGRAVLRVAAVVAVVAVLVHAATGALHGGLTVGEGSAAVAYRHILATPSWSVINLGMLLAVLAWLAVFVVVARSLTSTPGATGSGAPVLGRLAVVALTFGAAAASLLYLIDGATLPVLAERWAAAGPAQQAEIVEMGNAVQLVRVALFAGQPLFVFGLPFVLMGAALGLHPRYPSWLGWAGCVIGAAVFVTGVSWFIASFSLVPELILWVVYQPLLWLWLLALAVTLWRSDAPDISEPA